MSLSFGLTSKISKYPSKKVNEQRAYFENQLSQLGGYVSKKATAVVKAVTPNGKAGKRAKAKPKYQSKRDKSVKWSGRGMTPYGCGTR